MTEFQKEIAVVSLLLVFFFASFCYVEIVHTGLDHHQKEATCQIVRKNANQEG